VRSRRRRSSPTRTPAATGSSSPSAAARCGPGPCSRPREPSPTAMCGPTAFRRAPSWRPGDARAAPRGSRAWDSGVSFPVPRRS
jgi:hypothetical protein